MWAPARINFAAFSSFGGAVAHKWHVGHHQRAAIAFGDAADVIHHLIHGDRQGAVVALQYHAKRVSY
jgi:hypothetical protein